MKFCKHDDTFIDVTSKITTIFFTILTFGFGLYAYFHTIHPVFEKENELQGMRKEKINLSQENKRLSERNEQYEEEHKKNLKELSRLNTEKNTLNREVTDKQLTLKSLNQQVENLHNHVIISNLEVISGKLTAAYTLSVAGNRVDKFSIIEYSNELIERSNQYNNLNEYEKEAYLYFRKYLNNNKESPLKTQEQILRFAIYLPVTYQQENSNH